MRDRQTDRKSNTETQNIFYIPYKHVLFKPLLKINLTQQRDQIIATNKSVEYTLLLFAHVSS